MQLFAAYFPLINLFKNLLAAVAQQPFCQFAAEMFAFVDRTDDALLERTGTVNGGDETGKLHLVAGHFAKSGDRHLTAAPQAARSAPSWEL